MVLEHKNSPRSNQFLFCLFVFVRLATQKVNVSSTNYARAFQDYPYAGSAARLDSPCGHASTRSLHVGDQIIAVLRGKEEAQEWDFSFGICSALLCDYALRLKPGVLLLLNSTAHLGTGECL